MMGNEVLMSKIDTFFHKIIDNYLFEIGLFLILLLTILTRWHMAPITMLSADYKQQLVPWVDYYKKMGIVEGLSKKIGDYYVPYNLIIALISVLPGKTWAWLALLSCSCEYISCVFVYKILSLFNLVGREQRRNTLIISIAPLMLPMTCFNGALWKQSDAVYTCFIIISLYYVLKEKYTVGFVAFSFAFVIKMQAVFFLPFLIILYILNKKFSILQFMWLPLIYLLAGIPAVLCGRRITNVYGTYFKQMREDNGMFINIPNIYSLGMSDYPALYVPALCAVCCIFIMMTLYIKRQQSKMDNKRLLYLAGWVLWTCVMFLPNMRERYDYMAIFVITVFMLAFRQKRIWIAIILNLISCVTYSKYLFSAYSITIPLYCLVIPYLFCYIFMTYDFIIYIRENEKEGRNSNKGDQEVVIEET